MSNTSARYRCLFQVCVCDCFRCVVCQSYSIRSISGMSCGAVVLPALLETFIEQPVLPTAASFIMHISASDARVKVLLAFDMIQTLSSMDLLEQQSTAVFTHKHIITFIRKFHECFMNLTTSISSRTRQYCWFMRSIVISSSRWNGRSCRSLEHSAKSSVVCFGVCQIHEPYVPIQYGEYRDCALQLPHPKTCDANCKWFASECMCRLYESMHHVTLRYDITQNVTPCTSRKRNVGDCAFSLVLRVTVRYCRMTAATS